LTNEERFDGMLALGERVRARIRAIADEIHNQPEKHGPIDAALETWRVALLNLAWDVSEGAFTLAATRKQQVRAMRILNRCIYEYAVRLEYYAIERVTAIEDWIKSRAWLAKLVSRGIDEKDKANWDAETHQAYADMVSASGKLRRHKHTDMLKRILEARGHDQENAEKGVEHGENFYSIASSFVHGSEGVFYDMFSLEPGSESWKLHDRSLRLGEYDMLHEAVFYLILMLFAESMHRGKDLGAHSYWRELDLTSGKWEQTPKLG